MMQGDLLPPTQFDPSPTDPDPRYLHAFNARTESPPPVIEVREIDVVYTAVRGPTGAFLDLFA